MLIDSSGSRLVCALAEEGAERIVAEVVHAGEDAKQPIDAVVAGLLGHCTVADIYSIVVGIGPGSFIGTRTAISYANGFAAAGQGVELYGVSSLAAIAAGTGELPPPPVLRDARRGQWYLWSGDGNCAAHDEAGALAALVQSGASRVIVEVPEAMFEAWQEATTHPVGQAAGPVQDSEVAEALFPSTPEDFRIYTRHMPHWRQSGSIYFVTWRVHERRTTLPEPIRDLVADNLKHFNGERYHLVAFVVMDDHVHVLLKPIEGWELQKILHSSKSYTASRINEAMDSTGAVWQNESWDRIVRTEEELLEKVQYILNNPEKRWPGSGATYPWVYFDPAAAGRPWHQSLLNSESRQAQRPVLPDITSTLPSFIEQEVPLIEKLSKLGIESILTPGVSGEGLLRAMAAAEPLPYVEPVYLRGFT